MAVTPLPLPLPLNYVFIILLFLLLLHHPENYSLRITACSTRKVCVLHFGDLDYNTSYITRICKILVKCVIVSDIYIYTSETDIYIYTSERICLYFLIYDILWYRFLPFYLWLFKFQISNVDDILMLLIVDIIFVVLCAFHWYQVITFILTPYIQVMVVVLASFLIVKCYVVPHCCFWRLIT